MPSRILRLAPGLALHLAPAFAALVLVLSSPPVTPTPAAAQRPAAAPRSLVGDVVRVVDGDTIQVRLGDRIEKVRYIGIDTPEVSRRAGGPEPGAAEATALNRALVEGRRVRLELDVQERDRHGRLLAYVWVGDRLVNAELVRRGYAQVMTVPPNVRYQALFLRLQRDAREAGRGLWRGA
ncbi:MAG: thermonuclease family protein [Candidatus Rokubacteria bacterium]|nr:thermonuclease family protein [Candidatus Rokubacteria bacterium]